MASSSSASSNNDNPSPSPLERHQAREAKHLRSIAESALADIFLNVFNETFQEMSELDRLEQEYAETSSSTMTKKKSNDNRITPTVHWLTDWEKRVHSYTTYQNYMAGVAAGFCTFGTVLALALRRVPRSNAPVVVSPRHASYSSLDRVATNKSPKKTSKLTRRAPDPWQMTVDEARQVVASSRDGPSWNTVFSQIELIIAGAMGLAMSVFASSVWADHSGFYRNVSQLPLQPGQSHLCDQACPSLLQLYQRTLEQPAPPQQQKKKEQKKSHKSNNDNDNNAPVTTYHWVRQAAKGLVGESFADGVGDRALWELLELQHLPVGQDKPSDQELWEHPQSPHLKSVTHLVFHCRQRMALLHDLEQQHLAAKQNNNKKDGGSSDDEFWEPTTVPQPGVPPSYLGVDVMGGDEQDTGDDGEDALPEDAVSSFSDNTNTTSSQQPEETKQRWWFW